MLGQQQETTSPNISLHLMGLLLGNTKKYECFVVLTLLIILVLHQILLLVMGYKPLKYTYYVNFLFFKENCLCTLIKHCFVLHNLNWTSRFCRVLSG
jgi:hypothetical protein